MTESQAKKRVISIAAAEVGYHEQGNNWTKYAAELDPLGITWGEKQNLAWCGEFVLWCFWKAFGVTAGLQMLCSGNPSGIPLCSAGAQYFKDAGRWTHSPDVGDVIFFDYGSGINHTGIVERVSGGIVYTIEGNSSDQVAGRAYSVGESSIAGYGCPRWDIVANEPDTPLPDVPDEPEQPVEEPTKTYDVTLPLLMIGDESGYVKAAQTLLIARGYDCGNKPLVGTEKADGEFGRMTEKAVAFFQSKNDLDVDGEIGGQTWAALLKF